MSHGSRWLAVVALAASLGLAGPARALTLLDLAKGSSFQSGNGLLAFDDFSVTLNGRSSKKLSHYAVVVLGDGFAIQGLGGSGPRDARITLAYAVSAAPGHHLDGAALAFDAAHAAPGVATASEDLGGTSVWARLDQLVVVSLDASRTADATGPLALPSQLPVIEHIEVDGPRARLRGLTLTQNFAAAPEPGTALLLAGGLSALGLRRRRAA